MALNGAFGEWEMIVVEEQVSEGQDEKVYRTYTPHGWVGTLPQSVHLAPSLRRKVFVDPIITSLVVSR